MLQISPTDAVHLVHLQFHPNQTFTIVWNFIHSSGFYSPFLIRIRTSHTLSPSQFTSLSSFGGISFVWSPPSPHHHSTIAAFEFASRLNYTPPPPPPQAFYSVAARAYFLLVAQLFTIKMPSWPPSYRRPFIDGWAAPALLRFSQNLIITVPYTSRTLEKPLKF